MSPEQVRLFYGLFQAYEFAFIIDEPTPRHLVEKYSDLPEKRMLLLSFWRVDERTIFDINRHFLRNLQTPAFIVLNAADFIARWDADTLEFPQLP
ncbi:MAG: hypothetical protein H6633_09600 [Anaerolineales bacterium]|nr:hypothetical protein [Anaerolineales bacterium]